MVIQLAFGGLTFVFTPGAFLPREGPRK